MKRILVAALAVLAVAGLASAQFQTTGTGIRTVVDQLFEFVGTQKFRDNVTVGGNLAVTGTTTQTGALTASGGFVGNVTGALTGSIVSPLTVGTGTLVFGETTLTEAGGAQTLFTLTTATTQTTGGTLEYTVRIVDSVATADYSIRTGHLQFNMSNAAGTTICTGDAADQTDDDSFLTQQGDAKTNTYAITFVTGANTCAVKFNIDSDIATVTSASATWVLRLNGPGTVS